MFSQVYLEKVRFKYTIVWAVFITFILGQYTTIHMQSHSVFEIFDAFYHSRYCIVGRVLIANSIWKYVHGVCRSPNTISK